MKYVVEAVAVMGIVAVHTPGVEVVFARPFVDGSNAVSHVVGILLDNAFTSRGSSGSLWPERQ
jgi:hypothetical protein